jgi:GNAT superfamily N-acetyltransferase
MDEYKIERLTESKINDLFWLFKASSKGVTNVNEFVKKYDTKYTGVSYVGFLAYDNDNKPAAFYGVIPTVAYLNKKSVLIAQSADTLTHPKHQRKGLFTLLANKTYDLAKELGIEFIYGIANENSFPGFIKKLGWTHNGNMQILHTTTIMPPFAQLFRRNSFLKKIYNFWVSLVLQFFEKGNNILVFQDNDPSTFGIKKDISYYDYKSYSSKHLIKIKNRLFWLKFEGSLKIGDMEVLTPNEINSIMKKLKVIAFFSGIQKIQYQYSPNKQAFNGLTSVLSSTEGLPIIYLDLTKNIDPSNFVITLADVDTF